MIYVLLCFSLGKMLVMFDCYTFFEVQLLLNTDYIMYTLVEYL